MEQINIASEEVGAASDQVASGSQMLSQGATEQESAIEELSGQAQMLKSLIDKFVLKDSNKNIDFNKNEVNYFATND